MLPSIKIKMKMIRISAIWCASCIVTLPIWEEIKQKYPEFTFNELDYDMDEEEIKKYHIGNTIPVIIILDNENVELTRIIGEKNKKDIFHIIDDLKG